MNEKYYRHSGKEIIKQARKGIKKSDLSRIIRETGFTLQEMSNIIHVSPRSIQLKKEEDRFPPQVSEKALFIEKLFNKGREVFENRDSFKKWLMKKDPTMGGVAPYSLLDTFSGVELVFEKLIALEHGFCA